MSVYSCMEEVLRKKKKKAYFPMSLVTNIISQQPVQYKMNKPLWNIFWNLLHRN